MKHIRSLVLLLILSPIFFVPFVVSAAGDPKNFEELVGVFLDIINLLVPVVFSITFVVITWGIFTRWILGAGNPEKIKEGNNIALIGVIALVVMASIWAILALLRSSIFG